MDITNIEDEVYDFDNIFFQKVSSVVEEGLDFIENNHLIEPKENYVMLIDYLGTVINYFHNLDRSFMDSTFKKLQSDVNNLNGLYKKQKDILQNVEEIFKKNFKKQSNVIRVYTQEILEYKSADNLSNEEKIELKILLDYYKELDAVCFETFKSIFKEDCKYLLDSLLVVLNSKTYYLHEMFWHKAADSEAVQRLFRIQKIDGDISSKNYITHKLDVMLPYSKEYQYFKDCLRIYK